MPLMAAQRVLIVGATAARSGGAAIESLATPETLLDITVVARVRQKLDDEPGSA